MSDSTTLTIGQVAKRAGLRPSAIRYYESIGVLPEPQRVAGQRRYRAQVVDRLRLIAAGQEAGFSLEEIAELLRSSDRGRGSERLRELAAVKLAEVEAMIERATRTRRWLELASTCGCTTLEACALFAGRGPVERSSKAAPRR